MKSLGCVLLLCLAPAAAGQSGGFAPNHLFLTSNSNLNKIAEVDLNGNVVRFMGPFQNLSFPYSLAFGPNGNLYVAFLDSNRVGEIDASGAVVRTFGDGGELLGPISVAFGPGGNLYIVCYYGSTVVEFGADGNYKRTISLAPNTGPYGILFTPEGHILTTSAAARKIVETDNSGTLVKAFDVGVGTGVPLYLEHAGDGNILATVAANGTNVIAKLSASGQLLSTFPTATNQDPLDIDAGPDGNLYVTEWDTRVRVYTPAGALVRTLGPFSGFFAGPVCLAISPFRLKTKIKGSITRKAAPVKIINETGTLTFAPGSRTLMLQLSDDPSDALDLATIFDADAFVFHGFEVAKSDAEKTRVLEGTEFRWPSSESGFANCAVLWNGKIDAATGAFRAMKARGSIHRASAAAVLNATIITTKLLQ